MIKAHKRVHTGWMRRTSRIYLNDVNDKKIIALRDFLTNYQNALNYTIQRLWANKEITNTLADKEITDAISERFGLTARLAQCVAKQAKETIYSQRKRNIKTMPRCRSRIANLDSRFVEIEDFNGYFNMCLKFSSGVPKLIVPFNWTKHSNKFKENGWLLGKSIRLGYNENGLFIDLIFEKERPSLRTEGKVIGIDRGYNCMLSCSDGQEIGKELKPQIKKGGKRRKSWRHYITTEENRYLKELNLSGVKEIALENLKNVKMNKRGKFSRNMNRLLSMWHYRQGQKYLQQLCEEAGIRISLKNPAHTSQRCAICGNIDSRNRKGTRFLCLECGHADNADHNASKNLETLGLVGAYSLHSLQSGFIRKE